MLTKIEKHFVRGIIGEKDANSIITNGNSRSKSIIVFLACAKLFSFAVPAEVAANHKILL